MDLEVIAFSGGRTSGKMLRDYLDKHSGMPDHSVVVFNNTGKELEQTLEFVRDVGEQWGVEIIWTEYRTDRSKPAAVNGGKHVGRHSFAVVDFETASRNGEPFEQVVESYSAFRAATGGRGDILPNPVQRFCTAEMKRRTTERYVTSLRAEHVTTLIGLRYDEPARVFKTLAGSTALKTYDCPLYRSRTTMRDVLEFWDRQPFDLKLTNHPTLNTYQGNCDFCFLKSAAKIKRLAAERPDGVKWWADMEAKTGTTFRKDRFSYRDLLAGKVPLELLNDDTELNDCHCTD